MNNNQKQILKDMLSLELDKKTFENFQKYTQIFLEYNSHTNLMSKNDEKVLFEKHIFDSLALSLFLKTQKITNMLDVGTGGGFPSLPVAIAYPEISVSAMDSIQKKLNFIEQVKKELCLNNIETLHQRAENIAKSNLQSFDLVTCRAVSALKNLFSYAEPYIKSKGYFVAFKSKNFQTELDEAKEIMQKSKLKLSQIIDYNLPLEENFERKLLVFEKN